MRIDKRMLENLPEWMSRRDDLPPGWLYIGDEKERYLLGQPGNTNILVFGVNPSTASPGEKNLDPTIRKIRKMIKEDGFDGWIMANLYPLRATDPKKLPVKADNDLLKKNLKVLSALDKSYYIHRIWAAWGDTIDTRFYLGETLYDIVHVLCGDYEWYYRGTRTKSGNPRHPLYMKTDEKYEWFPAEDYAAGWRDADIR